MLGQIIEMQEGASTCSLLQPLILPEPHSGDGDYTEWHDHFESVAAFNLLATNDAYRRHGNLPP